MRDKDTITVTDTVINYDRFIHRYRKNKRDRYALKGKV